MGTRNKTTFRVPTCPKGSHSIWIVLVTKNVVLNSKNYIYKEEAWQPHLLDYFIYIYPFKNMFMCAGALPVCVSACHMNVVPTEGASETRKLRISCHGFQELTPISAWATKFLTAQPLLQPGWLTCPAHPLWSAFVSSSSPPFFFHFFKTGSHPTAQGNLALPATHLPPKCRLTKLVFFVFEHATSWTPKHTIIHAPTYMSCSNYTSPSFTLPHPFPSFCSSPEHWRVRLLLPFPIKPSSVHPVRLSCGHSPRLIQGWVCGAVNAIQTRSGQTAPAPNPNQASFMLCGWLSTFSPQ